jgi:hypothetical protein
VGGKKKKERKTVTHFLPKKVVRGSPPSGPHRKARAFRGSVPIFFRGDKRSSFLGACPMKVSFDSAVAARVHHDF